MPRQPKRRTPEPVDIALTAVRDNREGMTLMFAGEAFSVEPDQRFVVMPGAMGKGWKLRIYPLPELPQDG